MMKNLLVGDWYSKTIITDDITLEKAKIEYIQKYIYILANFMHTFFSP